MLTFRGVSIDRRIQEDRLGVRKTSLVNRPGWRQFDLVELSPGSAAVKDGAKPKTIATARQTENATTDVRFFKGKGGFCAIVTTDDLRFLALPGSHIQLPDTELEVPGPGIHGTAATGGNAGRPAAAAQTVTNQAMILGAGMATRFEPVSGDTTGFPKPGVPLAGGDSVIATLARQLYQHGIRRVIVNTFYMPDVVEDQLKALKKDLPGLDFIFINEDAPSGTAGGLVKALRQGKVDRHKPILIMQGDAVTDVDLSHLIKTHVRQNAKVTLGVQPVADDELDKMGILKTETGESGQIQAFIEKPGLEPGKQEKLKQIGNSRLGSTGIYVLSPEVYLEFLEQGHRKFQDGTIFDYAQDFFPALLKSQGKLWAERLAGYWNDIGNPRQYIAVLKDLAEHKVRLPVNLPNLMENGVVYWPGTRQKAEKSQARLAGNVIVAEKPDRT